MLTQQDIYAASSENRSPMLSKDNYVSWSSRLLRYAKSKPNGKFLVNSIKNGSYTDDELTKKEVKKMKADDQAIQTILTGLPKDVYAVVDRCDTAHEIWLRVEQMMKGIANQNENQTKNGNVVAARARGNGNGSNNNQIRCYNYRGLGIQLQAKEFDLMVVAGDIDEIEEVNANCILMANLQNASTSSTRTDKAPIYDSDGSPKGKSKASPRQPKHVPNSKKMLHLLHMDLCGLMRLESINGKRQPSVAPSPAPTSSAPQVLQTPTTSSTIADTALTLTNSSSQAIDIPNTS
uniref:Uncharacterized protein n=1 Tax=Tanacetum cinerariifolium TaxID=118510 RepID=A0A6L2MAC2_TANCI|nr:hypothetical protein [Tanacetum cinerariifolium]